MRLINYIKKYEDGGTPKDYNKMTIAERRKYITNWFRQKGGLGDIQIAAIVGNIQHESGSMLPTQENLAGGGDYGLVQWNGSRKKALLKRPNPHSLETQLNMIYDETVNNVGGVWTNNIGGQKAFLNSTDLQEATKIFRADYERPHHTALHDAKRFNYAQSAMKDIDPEYTVTLLPEENNYEGAQTGSYASGPVLPEEIIKQLYEGTFDWSQEGAGEKVSLAQQYMDIKVAQEEAEREAAEKEQKAHEDNLKQQLLQDQQRKEEMLSLLQQKEPPESQYNKMLAQGPPQVPAFRFQSDWYSPQQPQMQKGGSVMESIVGKIKMQNATVSI